MLICGNAISPGSRTIAHKDRIKKRLGYVACGYSQTGASMRELNGIGCYATAVSVCSGVSLLEKLTETFLLTPCSCMVIP